MALMRQGTPPAVQPSSPTLPAIIDTLTLNHMTSRGSGHESCDGKMFVLATRSKSRRSTPCLALNAMQQAVHIVVPLRCIEGLQISASDAGDGLA